MNPKLNVVSILARDLPDLWFQAVNAILYEGRHFTIDKGSYEGQTRLEFDYFTGHVVNPGYGSGTPEILPHIPAHLGIPDPVSFEYVYGGGGYSRSYVEYLMTPTREPGEQYTYGQRLVGCQVRGPLGGKWDSSKPGNYAIPGPRYCINQVEAIIETYKEYGHRNNQMVLQIARASDINLDDPPCLRHIDTRIQDNTLHFFVYFRSWDLWGGLPANLAAIQALKEYMAGEIGVEDGEMIVESKGLHLYGYAEDLAKMRCMNNSTR